MLLAFQIYMQPSARNPTLTSFAFPRILTSGPSHLTSGSDPGHPTRQQERHGPDLVLLVEWGKSHALETPWVSHSDLEVERTKCAFPKMWGLRDTRVTAGSGPFCIVLHCPATPPRAWHGVCEAQRK